MNARALQQRVIRSTMRTTRGAVIASLALGLAGNPVGAAPRTIRSAAPPPDRHASPALVFEANRGQADPRVKFVARGAGYMALLTSTEAVLQSPAAGTRVGAVLPLAEERAAHEMLEGARPRPSGKIVLRVGA